MENKLKKLNDELEELIVKTDKLDFQLKQLRWEKSKKKLMKVGDEIMELEYRWEIFDKKTQELGENI